MNAAVQPTMRNSRQHRSADQRIADLDQKIAELRSKQALRERKGDPVLREIQKLQKRLKSFIQLAHDHKRPDVANSAMGFKSMLERILVSEMGAPARADAGARDDET